MNNCCSAVNWPHPLPSPSPSETDAGASYREGEANFDTGWQALFLQLCWGERGQPSMTPYLAFWCNRPALAHAMGEGTPPGRAEGGGPWRAPLVLIAKLLESRFVFAGGCARMGDGDAQKGIIAQPQGDCYTSPSLLINC